MATSAALAALSALRGEPIEHQVAVNVLIAGVANAVAVCVELLGVIELRAGVEGGGDPVAIEAAIDAAGYSVA